MWDKIKRWWKHRKIKKQIELDHSIKNLESFLNGKHDISSIEAIYPCDKLILTVCFERDEELMAVDFSQYEKNNLIHLMCLTKDELPTVLEDSKYAETKMISRVVNNAAVYLKKYLDGSELWCYKF